MKTIILAAGLGRRLGELTSDKPKCLLQFGPETILQRIVRICAKVGLGDIILVTGYWAVQVEAAIEEIANANWARGIKFNCIFNPSYATINNCYSLLLGLPEKNEFIVVINSDDVFDSRILMGIANEGPSHLAIDNVKQLTKESMKIYMDGDQICRIGKWLHVKKSAGEYIGLAKVASKDIPLLRSSLEYIVDNQPDGFYEHAFDMMFEQTEVYPWFTNGLYWTEIDTKEDFAYSNFLFEKGLLE